jgi:hypothetical protein
MRIGRYGATKIFLGSFPGRKNGRCRATWWCISSGRVTYLVQPAPETLPLGGRRVRVHEWEDGHVEIHCDGRQLPYSIFNQNPLVDQGAVVENKRLGAVLSVIQSAQFERDQVRLASKKLTIRAKDRIKVALAKASEGPQSPIAQARSAAFSAFLKQFDDEQKQRQKRESAAAKLRRHKALEARLKAAAEGVLKPSTVLPVATPIHQPSPTHLSAPAPAPQQ